MAMSRATAIPMHTFTRNVSFTAAVRRSASGHFRPGRRRAPGAVMSAVPPKAEVKSEYCICYDGHLSCGQLGLGKLDTSISA
jgi:hypothetical protein